MVGVDLPGSASSGSNLVAAATASDQESVMNRPAPNRRLLRRPTIAETERIARDCPKEMLSVPVICRCDSTRNRLFARDGVPSRLRRLRRRYAEPQPKRGVVSQFVGAFQKLNATKTCRLKEEMKMSSERETSIDAVSIWGDGHEFSIDEPVWRAWLTLARPHGWEPAGTAPPVIDPETGRDLDDSEREFWGKIGNDGGYGP